MLAHKLLLAVASLNTLACAQELHCAFDGYKPVPGITANLINHHATLEMVWQAKPGQQLRAHFGLRDNHPVVQQLAARVGTGAWNILAGNVTPDFQVTTGSAASPRPSATSSRSSALIRPSKKTSASGIRFGTPRWLSREATTLQISHAPPTKSSAPPSPISRRVAASLPMALVLASPSMV